MTKAVHKNIEFVLFSGLFVLSLLSAIGFEKYYLIAVPFLALVFFSGWQHINIVFLLLMFTLPFSTELQLTPELGTDFPDELLMVLTAGLLIYYWCYSPSLVSKKITRHPIVVLLLITLLWGVVCTLFSTYPIISLKFLLAKSWYVGAFAVTPVIIFQEKETIKKAFTILAMTMLLIVIIILVRHSLYGFSFKGVNGALQPFFRNHVNYSAMLVCMIPVFFAFYKLTDSKRMKSWIAGAIIVLLTALFLSYARGAWLALITGMIAYWLIRRKLLLAAYISIIIAASGFVFWIKSGDRYLQYAHNYRTAIFHEDFGQHLQATYQFKDLSTAERFYRWIAGIRMIKYNALTGFGPATFYNNYKPYAVPAFKTWVSNNPEHSTVHNYFLLITIEQGIPGLIFFLLLTGCLLYYAERLYHRAKDAFYKTIAITTGVILVMILTVNSLSDLIETDKVGSLFFLCLSMLIVADIKCRRDLSNSSPDIQRIP
jgi:O-antigen ligase